MDQLIVSSLPSCPWRKKRLRITSTTELISKHHILQWHYHFSPSQSSHSPSLLSSLLSTVHLLLIMKTSTLLPQCSFHSLSKTTKITTSAAFSGPLGCPSTTTSPSTGLSLLIFYFSRSQLVCQNVDYLFDCVGITRQTYGSALRRRNSLS